jgi:hypothetical protein
MEAADFSEHFEDLHGQFAGGTDNQGGQPVELGPLLAVQFLQNWNDKGKRLAAPSLSRTQDITAFQR